MDPTQHTIVEGLTYASGLLSARQAPPSSAPPGNAAPPPAFNPLAMYTGVKEPRTDVGPPMAIAQIIIAAVMIVFVLLRVYTRAIITKAFGADDALIIGGTIGSVALVVIHYKLTYEHGIGLTMEVYRVGWMVEFIWALKYLYFSQVVSAACLLLVKGSVLILFRRILQFGKTRIFLNLATFIILSFATIWLFLSIFQCFPPSVYWTEASKARVQPKQCIKDRIYIMNQIFPAINACTDLIIWLLPLPAILKVQLPKRDKIIVVMLLMVGAGAVSSSIARAVLHRLNDIKVQPMYAAAPLSLLTALEPMLGIICASLFTLRPVAHHIKNKISTLSSRSTQNDNASQNSTKGLGSQEKSRGKSDVVESIHEVEHYQERFNEKNGV